METVELAKEKKLALVAGFCWRYDYARRELFQRIHDGAIGDVVSIYGTYLTSPEGKTKLGYGHVTGMDKLARRGVGTTHHCAHGKQAWHPRDRRPLPR